MLDILGDGSTAQSAIQSISVDCDQRVFQEPRLVDDGHNSSHIMSKVCTMIFSTLPSSGLTNLSQIPYSFRDYRAQLQVDCSESMDREDASSVMKSVSKPSPFILRMPTRCRIWRKTSIPEEREDDHHKFCNACNNGQFIIYWLRQCTAD